MAWSELALLAVAVTPAIVNEGQQFIIVHPAGQRESDVMSESLMTCSCMEPIYVLYNLALSHVLQAVFQST